MYSYLATDGIVRTEPVRSSIEISNRAHMEIEASDVGILPRKNKSISIQRL